MGKRTWQMTKDGLLVKIANYLLRFTSKWYQDQLTHTINLGLKERYGMRNESVTEVAQTTGDGVDFHQEAMIDVEDVDPTAAFVSHPAWSLFGDSIHQED